MKHVNDWSDKNVLKYIIVDHASSLILYLYLSILKGTHWQMKQQGMYLIIKNNITSDMTLVQAVISPITEILSDNYQCI